jgi:hypothetical protein
MSLSFSRDRQREQQITVITGLVLLVSAFVFPNRPDLKDGGVLVIALTVILGRRVANTMTTGLAILITALLVAEGLLLSLNVLVSEMLYYGGVGLFVCLCIAYFVSYLRGMNRGNEIHI